MLPAVKELREVLVNAISQEHECILISVRQDKHGLALPDACQRWLQHHSALEQGDAVILGAASVKQLEMNISHWYVSDVWRPEKTSHRFHFQRTWPPVRGRR